MPADFEISLECNDYRLMGTVAYSDSGSAGAGSIAFYGTTQPDFGEDPGGTALVTVVLAVPSGSVIDHVLQLVQASSIGDFISNTGIALWARWSNSDGGIVADGKVTDDAGTGPFKIGGADGTQLYAGGRMILGTTAFM